jgi:hypothetical protein
MAQLTFAFGSSHGPILGPTEGWLRIAETDKKDIRLNYDQLLQTAPKGLEAEIAPENMQKNYEAVQKGIKELREVVLDNPADVIVCVSNPHGNVPLNRMQPVFGIFLSPEAPGPDALERPRLEARADTNGHQPRSTAPAAEGGGERQVGRAENFRTEPELADHLMESLIEDGIDVACAFETEPGSGIGRDHAFTIIYGTYLPADSPVPMVPFVISRYGPNLATPKRCYELGLALRRAIESWKSEKRVALMASGGLSHQILDPELDQEVLKGLSTQDTSLLCGLPQDRLNRGGGTPEIRNWITVSAAMGRPVHLVGYVPCYRSLAGTGHGMTFGYWK